MRLLEREEIQTNVIEDKRNVLYYRQKRMKRNTKRQSVLLMSFNRKFIRRLNFFILQKQSKVEQSFYLELINYMKSALSIPKKC